VLVFVDQFEELYTLCSSSSERAAFLACLVGVADDAGSPLRVLVSIRSDFLDRLAEYRDLADRVSHGLMFVPPLDRDGLRDALICPVEAADCRYEDRGMVDEMLDAVAAAPGSLPLLQFAAARLWTERDRDRRLLTRASYAAMGGIAGTLAGHADHVLGTIPGPERALVRAIFERLVTPERTRAVVSLSELRELPGNPDDIERLIYRLVDARLLVVEARAGGERAAELVHESLIGGWPTLNGWLDENRDDAAFLSRLRTAAAEWQASDRDEGVLWRDEPARQALAWLVHYRGELGRRERAYLDAVHDIASRTERRRRLVRRQVIAAAVAVPVILLAVASVALVRISRAEREARETAGQLSTQAAELRDKKDALEKALKKSEEDEAENRKLLKQTQEASEQAEAERDRARQQQELAERARDQARRAARQAQIERARAERAAQQARIEKAHAERAALEAEEQRKKAAEALQRAIQSEQDRKLLRERAVGPIQQEL
jgi:eukaryotic-like serine/threonine-protein kinase